MGQFIQCPYYSLSLRERATAVEKARSWIATVAALTPTLSPRERE